MSKQETVSIEVPRWRKFSEELPESDIEPIFITDGESIWASFLINFKLINNEQIFGSFYWTYPKSAKHTDGLDLQPLLPS